MRTSVRPVELSVRERRHVVKGLRTLAWGLSAGWVPTGRQVAGRMVYMRTSTKWRRMEELRQLADRIEGKGRRVR
jgi:hypothetical protein